MKQPESSALVVPFVEVEGIKKSTSVINDTTKSGKQLGAMLCTIREEKLVLVIAQDSQPKAYWDCLVSEESIKPV